MARFGPLSYERNLEMKKTQTIICYEKSAYGRTHIYFESPEVELLVSVLTGKKTVSRDELQALADLGLSIELNKVEIWRTA
jgi:hypothetical protein